MNVTFSVFNFHFQSGDKVVKKCAVVERYFNAMIRHRFRDMDFSGAFLILDPGLVMSSSNHFLLLSTWYLQLLSINIMYFVVNAECVKYSETCL